MFLAKDKAVCLLLIVLSSFLVSTSIFAVDKRDLGPIEKANLQTNTISSETQDEKDVPTVENMLKAKQAGDLEKATRIQAILNEEAKKFWRSPGGDEIVVESPYPIPPQRDNAFYKSYLWDNDHCICRGPVSGGISVDYDTSGNVYAVRCTTWNGVANASIKVYKSTDGGKGWSELTSFASVHSYSYPVVLTGRTGNKLYVFYLYSYQNGSIRVHRYDQSGMQEGTYDVKVDTDTITYFSACVDYENGNHLMVAYQKEVTGDATPNLYTITSADYGETWSNEGLVWGDGAHPDIAYGRNGYVYLVFEQTIGGDYEIMFIRSTDYCSPGSWEYIQQLTFDFYDDDNYPKVAALHTLPDSIPYVWVAYNHENPAGTNIDLRYAYSCNGGEFWSKNHILDSSTVFHEMACDLWTKRSPGYSYVNVCYFKGRYVHPFPHGHIFYGRVSSTNPTYWGWLFEISNHWPTQSEDGRKVCQGTYAQGNCAIMYAGKDPDDPFGDNFQNLWFDNSAWPTDVEEEMTEGEVPARFSLSANYPNPFNPVTRIQYSVGSRQTHPLPITLRIYNVLGQLVRTLVNEPKEPGSYEVIWDGKDENGNEAASGIYFYRLQAEDFTKAKKMLLLK
ncbi:MAG: T9SS type A sorting domain-containing protein [candidate division Zixibacteria bacterium]|nr:T9SS type A sorting domain-containing protein [candidate division Zixibacteria bacterium]